MKDKYKIVETDHTDLVCDNPTCSFEVPGVPDRDFWLYVNVKCVSCGDVILTQGDYKHFLSMKKMIKWINWLCLPYMWIIGGREQKDVNTVSYHHHDGTTTIKNHKDEKTGA